MLIFFTGIFSSAEDIVPKSPEVEYFPVFEFSPQTTAMTLELFTGNNIPAVDSAFNKIVSQDTLIYFETDTSDYTFFDCTPVDTAGRFKLRYNKHLEDTFKTMFSGKYFVYCTKAMVERTIKDVLFAVDLCKSNLIAFRFDAIDTAKNGHPLFCSKRKLDIKYANFTTLESRLNEFSKNAESDYTDYTDTKVVASSGSNYYSYNDDFEWNNNPNDTICFFPSRQIFSKGKSDTIQIKWYSALDLWGIPCSQQVEE